MSGAGAPLARTGAPRCVSACPPPEGAAQSLTKSVDQVGNSLSVAQARQACFDRLVND